jgi:hypothetical protein
MRAESGDHAMKAFLGRINISPRQYAVFENLARECLNACRIVATDGTALFRPDGSGHYNAMWTRDFCYLVEGAGHLMDRAEILAAIDYLLGGQREDGLIPDRRHADGTAVYFAGPVDNPLGSAPPTDNAQFLVKAVAAYVALTNDLQAFLDRRDALYRAMDSVPLSADLLVYVDPNRPHPGYGFTDCIAKTGNELFSSMLYWEACQALAKLCARCEYHDEAHDWYERAEASSRRLGDFWSEDAGLFWAASQDCRQLDLWGSAYACVIRLASKSQAARVAEFFVRNAERCILHGQLRHLVVGEYWSRMLRDLAPDTYQNGGYWATPSGWLVQTVNLADPQAAHDLLDALEADFTTHGVHEWISPAGRHVPGYVASIANVLRVVQPSKKCAEN